MANPVLVEVTRGSVVESRHRGAFVVMDAAGGIVAQAGDIAQPVFPRSAVKAIQALPLIESGAADGFGFGETEIALACASHSGEPAHAALAASMLARAGLDHSALECGWHWPMRQEAALELAAAGSRPSALHNNCSGKHAGFICTCRHLGIDHRGYVASGHAEQELIREAMESVTGAAHGEDACGTDGCSIPTYAVPLTALALGFARMATGQRLEPSRASAARRILSACMAEPFFMSGIGTADLALITAADGRAFVKTGAEGVYCGAIPELGLGIALKCDDGASRGSEAMVAAVMARLFAGDETLAGRLAEIARPAILSRRGAEVGRIRPVGALA
jgi:L-asparaginase II